MSDWEVVEPEQSNWESAPANQGGNFLTDAISKLVGMAPPSVGINAPRDLGGTLDFLGGITKKAGDFVAPTATEKITNSSNNLSMGSNKPMSLPDAAANAAKQTGDFAKYIFDPKLIKELGTIAAGAEVAPVVGGAIGNIVSKGAKFTGPVVESIANASKYLTKGGLSSLTDEAATAATKEGQYIHWDDLMEQARERIIKQLGDNKATRKAFSNVTAPRTPAGIESLPETLRQTPENLLTLRRNLINSYGKNILQGSSESGLSALEQKIAGIVRGTVSDNLHRIAPGTVRPDQMYRIYSKSGPVAKQLLKLIGVPALAITGWESLK